MSNPSSLKKWSAAHPVVSCAGWSLGIVLFIALFPFGAVLDGVASAFSFLMRIADDHAKLYFSALLFVTLFSFCLGFSLDSHVGKGKHSVCLKLLGFFTLVFLLVSAIGLGGNPSESRAANRFLNTAADRLALRLDPRMLTSECERGAAFVSVAPTPSSEGQGPRIFLCEVADGGRVTREHFLSNIDIASLGCSADEGCSAPLPWEARYDADRDAVAFLRANQTPEQCRLVVKKLDDRWKEHLLINGQAGQACSAPSNDLLVAYPVAILRSR